MQVQSILTGQDGSPGKGKGFGSRADQVKKVTQEILISQISPSGRQELRKKLVAKRNVVTTRGLAAGTYVAQVQARAVSQKGVVTKSRVSKGAKFTISN